MYILLRTISFSRCQEAVQNLRKADEEYFNRYLQPRVINRRSMQCNAAVLTMGQRNTNFVEVTHRRIKRAGLGRSVPLYKCIQLCSKVLEHYVTERQIDNQRHSVNFPSIENRPDLNLFMDSFFPTVVERMWVDFRIRL